MFSRQTRVASSGFALGHAASPHWRIAVADCLEQLDTAAAAGANLGFLYLSDRYAARATEILELLRARTRVEHWVGTVGASVCAGGQEYADQGACAVMLGCFEPGCFRVLSSLRSMADLARDPLTVGGTAGHFALLHGDPRNAMIPALVAEISRRLDSGFVAGGLSGPRGAHAQIADAVVEGGVSGVLFTDQVMVATRITQGCTPVGPWRRVSRAERNVVIQLDGRAALQVMREDAALAATADLQGAADTVFAALPAGEQGEDYLVRPLAGIDAARGLVAVAEEVRQGSRLRFCRRDGLAAGEDMARMLASIRSGLFTRPRGAVYHACLGRGRGLFGEPARELHMIREALGEVPLVGIYGSGEIFRDRVHGYAGVLTLFP
ncbi:MAG: FIST N-terminal domain-containing protein [Betaproteobacteria bacterium]